MRVLGVTLVAVAIGVLTIPKLIDGGGQRVDSIGLDQIDGDPQGATEQTEPQSVEAPLGGADVEQTVPLIAVAGPEQAGSTPPLSVAPSLDPDAANADSSPPSDAPESSTPSAGSNEPAGSSAPDPATSAPSATTIVSGPSNSTAEPTATMPAQITTTTAAPVATTQPSPPPSGDLAARLYPGWCRSGPLSAPGVSGSDRVTVAPGQSIQAAIDASSGGIVELAAGVHTISRPLEMKGGVIVRGASRAAIIRTSSAMNQMVEFGGGFTGSRVGSLTVARAFTRSITTDGATLSPGLWLIGGTAGGQLVRVLSVDGNRATLELPLAQDFSGSSIARQNGPITRAGLERVTLQPRHSVRDLVMIRSALDVWVKDIETDGSGGQVRSAVYLRQAYRVGVYGSRFVTARELGDGGQGYGINIANNSSNTLIDGNQLERFRHSILLQAGAAGNVVRGNTSQDARHPNFVEGGPADISFHGYSSGNLVMGNSIERIQINDAGSPGPYNAIVDNTLRVGPLTLDNGVDKLTLLGNQMLGSVEELRAKTMPPIVAVSTAGNPSPQRQYWSYGYDPFGRSGDTSFDRFGDGILDWGSGSDIYVDPAVGSIDPCNL